MLSGSHRQLALAWLDEGSLTERLLSACLDHPSPARGRVLVALVQHSAAARASFARRLPSLLEGASAPAADAAGAEGARRALLAALLPAGQAVLQLGSGGPVAGQGPDPAAAEVAACLRRPLLAFLANKHSAAAAVAPDSAADPSLLLHAHALPCLRLCLALQPLGPAERERLLSRLLPPKGLSLGPGSLGAGALATTGPSAADRAQAAMVVLEAQQAGAPGQRASAAKLLLYLQPYAATLAALFK